VRGAARAPRAAAALVLLVVPLVLAGVAGWAGAIGTLNPPPLPACIARATHLTTSLVWRVSLTHWLLRSQPKKCR
jgi:hypothetical protein